MAVGVESLLSGMALTIVTMLIMQWCNKKHIAAQFAFLTAIAAAFRVLFGGVVGFVADYIGWQSLFAVTLTLTVVPISILLFRLNDSKVPIFAIL
jgi:MFS family permease